MPRRREVAAGKYALELDGVTAGWLQSASGGDAEGEVVQETIGADQIVRKHIAAVHYTDIELSCGAGMETSIYDWLASTIEHKFVRKDGAVSSLDFNSKEVARLNFFNAVVREIAFPALDAASKDQATLTVTVAPEYARRVKGSGAKSSSVGTKGKKPWFPSTFRLTIDGIDGKGVSKVEPIVVTQTVAESAIGELREFEKEPAHLELGDLVVTVAESKAADFVAWHNDFVIKGNNGTDAEKTGTLEFLTSDLKQVLFTLELKGLGIFKLVREAGAAAEGISKLRASMYCEELVFSAG